MVARKELLEKNRELLRVNSDISNEDCMCLILYICYFKIDADRNRFINLHPAQTGSKLTRALIG